MLRAPAPSSLRPGPRSRPCRTAGVRPALSAVLLAGVLLAGCGSDPGSAAPPTPAPGAPAPSVPSAAPAPGPAPASPTVDPAVAPYCAAVARVQAEQTAPGAGQGAVEASSDAARRQVAELAAVAPPEIAPQWRTLQELTDRALGLITAAAGDAARVDRAGLDRLQQESLPAVAAIKDVTSRRCGIAFRPSA